jgi:hypothetical protein
LTHNLDPLEAHWLREANRFLDHVTESHRHDCTCELCRARVLCDCQDSESLTIPGVTFWEEGYITED